MEINLILKTDFPKNLLINNDHTSCGAKNKKNQLLRLAIVKSFHFFLNLLMSLKITTKLCAKGLK